jgi:hypothetical protein
MLKPTSIKQALSNYPISCAKKRTSVRNNHPRAYGTHPRTLKTSAETIQERDSRVKAWYDAKISALLYSSEALDDMDFGLEEDPVPNIEYKPSTRQSSMGLTLRT